MYDKNKYLCFGVTKLQLLRQRFPFSIQSTIRMLMATIQLLVFQNDAVQIPDPVGVNTWLHTRHHQKRRHLPKMIYSQNLKLKKEYFFSHHTLPPDSVRRSDTQ